MNDQLYIDLNNPNRGLFKVKEHQFRSLKLREMVAAGFSIEKDGAWYEVFSNELLFGQTHSYRTLKEIEANANSYLALKERD